MNAEHATRDRKSPKADAGFTLIEIMAVVIIMGMLMGMVGVGVFAQVQRARATTAKVKMDQLEQALEFYRLDNSRYPTTDQGLEALVSQPSAGPTVRHYPKGGYLRRAEAMSDPWGELYQYESPGQHNPDTFDLWSFGADQSPGGTDSDADIGNWDSSGES
jgi:general secretion pathway protein G